MFIYMLFGDDYEINLTHKEKFSDKEFKTMCKEAETRRVGKIEYYDDYKISKYLIESKGFKLMECESSFFTEGRVPEF